MCPGTANPGLTYDAIARQVGLDMAINDRWFVNASAWLIDIDTDVRTAVGTINTSIDPVAFMFGVGYRF